MSRKLTAALMVVAATAIAAIAPSALAIADDPPEVSVGVMRYDSKNPTLAVPSQYSATMAALGDSKWNDLGYWSFFAEVDSSGDLFRLNENSVEVAEQENQYAADAGVDYWAFLHAPSPEIEADAGHYSASFQRYLESSNKSDVMFTWILNFHSFEYEGSLDEAISYVDDPDYFTVLDGRPLIYIFDSGENADLSVNIPYLRSEVQALGKPNPYIVLFNKSGYGEDATSDYATSGRDAVIGATYDSYIDRVSNEWENPNQSVDYAQTGGSHGGSYKGVHWTAVGTPNTTPVATQQTITGLSTGTYTLKAWVSSSPTPGTVEMFARNCGGADAAITIPSNSGSYQELTLGGISVVGTSCTIGVSSDEKPGDQWIAFDDVSFASNAAPTVNLVQNPGFEEGTEGAAQVPSPLYWDTDAPVASGLDYVPNAPLNWDNRPFAENEPPWGALPGHWNAPPTQDQYRRMLQEAVNFVIDNDELSPAMTIVSKEWNGQEEGGNIAPSLRYGALYTDAIGDVRWSESGSFAPVDEVPQNYLKFQTYNDLENTSQYVYQRFSDETRVLQSGDYLEYDVNVQIEVPGSGGIEIGTSTGGHVFDTAAYDQNSLSAHASEGLSGVAYQQWYHRKIPIPAGQIGATANSWLVGSESDGSAASTTTLYDNVEITDGSGTTRQVIFTDAADATAGPIAKRNLASGYLSFVDESGSRGGNLLNNPGFELGTASAPQVQSPQDWSTTGPNTASNYAQSGSSDSHGGDYRGVHWGSSTYSVGTSQTVDDLEDGRYTYTAWVRSSTSSGESYMFAEGCGGADRRYTVPAGSSAYQKLTLSGIDVSGGECTVGFRSTSVAGSEWIAFDDLEFTKDARNFVANPGFELGTSGATTVDSPQSWTTSGADSDADFASKDDARAGEYRAAHSKTSSYTVTTSQSITGLANGYYTLTAWTKALTFVGTARMSVTCGSEIQHYNIPMSRVYQQIRIESTHSTTGTCTIAFESTSSAAREVFSFDDVAFYRQ